MKPTRRRDRLLDEALLIDRLGPSRACRIIGIEPPSPRVAVRFRGLASLYVHERLGSTRKDYELREVLKRWIDVTD